RRASDLRIFFPSIKKGDKSRRMSDALPAPLIDLEGWESERQPSRPRRPVSGHQAGLQERLDAFCGQGIAPGHETLPAAPTTVGIYLDGSCWPADAFDAAPPRRRDRRGAQAGRPSFRRTPPGDPRRVAGIRGELGARPNTKNAITVNELRAMI